MDNSCESRNLSGGDFLVFDSVDELNSLDHFNFWLYLLHRDLIDTNGRASKVPARPNNAL
jgi:hypothetical protein